ncbi:translocation/assembly module TamB [Aureimonas sp. SA4125]|uniref:translocation/assembly module TamB domain-containing protein n=1 Tax=Aureimonas sp. SA4125 TaxID=2826993 RepID=UPI001CC451F3|nr:translocation/assembly module TamB domain-containing protein [Aureimonas sp. SA4125]BDA82842.1 translocation/assembly module TamB [Aureimonas sp. SA4125]
MILGFLPPLRLYVRFAVLALVVLAGLGAFARPAAAQEFLARQIEGLISTDTMQVKIDGLSGALSGNLRISSVTVADAQGVYLTARDLAMDWSPLAVIRSRVAVESLTAGQIILERLPESPPADPNAEPSSGLPNITADIQRIAITEFVLGEAIAGVRARLSANGKLVLDADPTKLDVAIGVKRLDQPGDITAALVFAPEENRLEIRVDASEPAGGLVATLLKLPGAPPVSLTIGGSGPLGAFMANGALTVGGEPAATLTAKVDDVDAGRRVAASLQVAAERFVPEAYKAFAEGGANLDVRATLRDDGVVAIEAAELSSGQITATVAGTLDRAGPQTALDLAIASRDGGSIPLQFGAEGSRTIVDIASLKGKIAGALAAASLDLTATLPTAGYGAYVATDLKAHVTSSDFDLSGLSGPLQIELAAASVVAPAGTARRFLTGPVTVSAEGALGTDGITLSQSRITTEVANAAITGTAAMNFSTFDLTLSSDFDTLALSAALVPLAGDRMAVGGRVARAADGGFAANDLAITGTGLSVTGAAALTGGQISADIAGTLDAASGEDATISGKAAFALTASGPSEKPDVDVSLTSQGLMVNGRELADLKVEARGDFASASPAGSVDISGTLDGQPLSGTARVETLPTGERRISNLAIRQGPNVISGDLTLGEALAPVGTLTVDVADIGPLAALALQQMSGDLDGTIALSVVNEFPLAKVDLASNQLAVGGNTLSDVAIDLAVTDYLGQPFPEGSIRAGRIVAGGATVDGADIALARKGDVTQVDAQARANGVPVALSGQAMIAPTETTVALDTLTAAIENAAVALQQRATVRIADGVTTLDGLNLAVGAGTLALTGSVGPTYDLRAEMTNVPVAVANPFVTDLQAAGTVSGSAVVTGAAADPQAQFDVSARDIETRQTRAARIEPVQAVLGGRYAGGALALDKADVSLGDGRISATGTAGDSLDVSIVFDAIPVALANGFVDGIDASGTVSGTAKATGTLAAPQATFDFAGRDITAAAVAAAGVPPIALRLDGSYAEQTLTLGTARATLGAASLDVAGSIGQALDLRVTMTALPVALANGFVPGLNATGTLDGTATATGSLTQPAAEFDVTGSGITTEAIAAGGIPTVELRLAGSFADGTARIETGVANIGAASLTATGTVGQTLDLDVALNAVPVGLVNGYMPDLKAEGTLSGTARASGTLSDPQATFNLAGTGITAEQIKASGIAPLSLDLSGSVADRTATIETARVLVGDGSLTATGTVGDQMNLDVVLSEIPVGLANGFVPNLGATGLLSGNAKATGSLNDPAATFALRGTGITATQVAAAGIAPVELTVDGTYAKGTATIGTSRADIGEASLTATGTVGEALDLDVVLDALPVGLVNGYLPDLRASGTLSGTARATGSLADPQATFQLRGREITAEQVRASGVAPINLDVDGSYAEGTATLATARAEIGEGSLSATGTVGQALDLDVVLDKLPVGLVNGFVPNLKASGTLSGSAEATGSLADPRATFQLSGTGITAEQVRASGVAPIRLEVAGSYAGGTATLATARAEIGDGSIEASGTVGQALDLNVSLDRLPVGLANGFVPDLGAQGTLSGTASATGSITDPNAVFDISAAGVSVAQTRAAGAPAVAAIARGSYRDARLAIETARVDVGGGTLTVAGSAGDTLDLTVDIANIPASLAAAAAAGIDPQGTINGSLRATGPASNPAATYDLRAAGLSLAQTRDAGVGPLDLTASGRFADKTLTLDADLAGSGLTFAANGSVDLAGAPQLDLALNGTVPLSIANRILAEGGRSVSGTASVNATVTGSATAPSVNGTIATSGASFTDGGLNLAVNGISTTIALTGQTATIQSFSAQLAAGGTISVGGTVGLANGFPADITVRIAEGRYNDGELLAARLNADLTLTGPLTGSPVLAGTINAISINILVPERLPTSLARIDVRHRNAPEAVLRQQAAIAPKGSKGASSAGLALDLTFNAPSRVFVRGRGLDIELGGSIDITGPASSPSITGGFELQRGRFTILANRLDFERGRLTFTGDLIPTLDLLATSVSGDVTVTIAVTGPANDPSFNFSSTPALPQDEVLARLIFKQGTANLSPLQIAQLAEAAAQLAGVGGSSGLLENLRAQLGVDDLDIKTNADGQTAVGVGKYLNDNTYVGVDSTGRISIDLDLGKGLKARGAVSATGGGEVGVFYENEY